MHFFNMNLKNNCYCTFFDIDLKNDFDLTTFFWNLVSGWIGKKIWWAAHKICQSTYILSHISINLIILGDFEFQIIFSVVDKKRDFTHGLCARRTLWYFNRRNCYGVMKRHLCNLDLRDLPEVYERHCLFINKFDLSVDAKIVACLHEFLTMNKDRWEIYRN